MTNEHRGAGRARLDAAGAALGLEMLFADVASGPLRPDLPLARAMRMAAALAGRPLTLARRGAGLAAELARIGLGRSTLAPSHDDRYADPAWSDNPLLRRFVQAHIAAGAIASDLIADARLGGPDDERIRSVVTALLDALAPSNAPLNPVVWQASPSGESAVRGVARLTGELAAPPRVPAAPGTRGFEVGTDVAATPGAVILRTPVAELIQYLPQTAEVRDLPLLVVPPMATRHYLADLTPGRSIAAHLVRGGQQRHGRHAGLGGSVGPAGLPRRQRPRGSAGPAAAGRPPARPAPPRHRPPGRTGTGGAGLARRHGAPSGGPAP